MNKKLLPVTLTVLTLLVLLAASGAVAGFAQAEASPSEPLAFESATPQPTATRFIDGLLSNATPDLAGMPSTAPLGATGMPEADTPAAEEAPVGQHPTDETPAPTPTKALNNIVAPRTPVPTATPGVIQREVTRLVARTGLARTQVLGLEVTDWISLGSSLLLVLLSYLVSTWLIRRILLRIVRRIPTDFDDQLLAAGGEDIRWLVVILTSSFATTRLVFISAGLKALLNDAYYVIGLLLVVRIAFKLIDLADGWLRERSRATGREEALEPLIVLLTRLGRVLVVVLAISVALSHFGVNVVAFATTLGLAGLAISLAAKDTIADAISGFIILVDRPFRIGDRIEIQGIGTWGDVMDIGLRTTRIRTRDNRLVIVPNSVIGTNQVINYSYPDPQYRIETYVGVAYGTDIETARQLMVDTVRKVEGVESNRPVDALYDEMGDSAMVFRVRWWIESYRDTRRMFDKVHTALQHALEEAGIDCPFPTQGSGNQMEPNSGDGVSAVFAMFTLALLVGVVMSLLRG
jgi:MscS family membrane protein